VRATDFQLPSGDRNVGTVYGLQDGGTQRPVEILAR